MSEPTLQEVFGANAAQTSTTITISKADLASTGLTASANNNAEALMVALVMKATGALSEVARTQDLVNRNVTVNYGGQDLIEQAGGNYRRDAFSVLLYKTTTLATIIPNDY